MPPDRTISTPNDFANNTVADAELVDANFAHIKTQFDAHNHTDKQTFIAALATDVPLTLRGHASQSANLMVVEKSDGTDLLTLASDGTLTLQNSAKLRYKSGVAVTNYTRPANVIAAGTIVLEMDPSGNVLIGPNVHVQADRAGNDDFDIPDWFYKADTRVQYFRAGVKIAQIGDPPDLTLACAGPDNAEPDATPQGVLSGKALGTIHFKGWFTPNGQTPPAPGGNWHADSVTILAFATENNVQGAGTYSQGGELVIRTTANGTETPTDRIVLGHSGYMALLSSGFTKANALSLGSRGNVLAGEDVWARSNQSQQVKIGAVGPSSEAGVLFGNTGTAVIYKSAADELTVADKTIFAAEIELDGALNHDGTTAGFFGVAPVVRPSAYTQTYATADKTLAAYTADVESVAYTGAADGEAKLVDLNALRVAYENLRALAEDTAQMVNSVVDDLQALGLVA